MALPAHVIYQVELHEDRDNPMARGGRAVLAILLHLIGNWPGTGPDATVAHVYGNRVSVRVLDRSSGQVLRTLSFGRDRAAAEGSFAELTEALTTMDAADFAVRWELPRD